MGVPLFSQGLTLKLSCTELYLNSLRPRIGNFNRFNKKFEQTFGVIVSPMPRNSYSIHWSYFRKYTQQNKLETLLLGHSKRLVPSYRVSLHRVLVPLTSICPLFIHFLFTLDTSLFRRIFDGLKYLKFYILINEIRFRIWTGTKILLPSQII